MAKKPEPPVYEFLTGVAITPIVRSNRVRKSKYPFSEIKPGDNPMLIRGVTTQRLSPEIKKVKEYLRASFTTRTAYDQKTGEKIGVLVWRDRVTVENKRPRNGQ